MTSATGAQPMAIDKWEIQEAANTIIRSESLKIRMKRDVAFKKLVRTEIKKQDKQRQDEAKAATVAKKV